MTSDTRKESIRIPKRREEFGIYRYQQKMESARPSPKEIQKRPRYADTITNATTPPMQVDIPAMHAKQTPTPNMEKGTQ